jgi:predicted Zn-dependent protease
VPAWFQAKLVVKTLASLLALTPDLDRSTLSRLRSFAEALVDGEAATLAVPQRGVRLEVDGRTRLLGRLRIEERTLRIMVAEAAVRLGDDDDARRQVQRSLVGCESCWTLLANAALITAQTGRTEGALELATRARALAPPGKLDALQARLELANAWRRRVEASPTDVNRAGFYAAVGCHGRAYAAAGTALRSPPSDPGARSALAEIAYQAGDVRRTRELLALGRSPAAIEQALEQLGSRVRWRDQNPDATRWLPASLDIADERPANQRGGSATSRASAPDLAGEGR